MSPSSLKAALHTARVLVVDDDPFALALINRLVEPVVAELLLAHDGVTGLEVWRHEQPDVIITDVNMPDMDGLTMSGKIKSMDPDAQIIVLSGSNKTENLTRAIEVGVDRYVFKPVDAKLLIDALAKSFKDRQRALDIRMAQMVFEVANEGIMITDTVPNVLMVNPAFSQITGYRPDEIIGQPTSILSSGEHDEAFYRGLWSTLHAHGRWSGEITNRRKNGDRYTQWLSIAAVSSRFSGVQRYVGLISDISDRKREEEQIRRLAHFDNLTGLPNRAQFNDRLSREIAAANRKRTELAVLYVDLDYFKQINDKFGHAMGDEVLRLTASRMCANVRQTDTVSRRGGDEFVVILDANEGKASAQIVCEKIADALAQPCVINGKTIHIGVSIGVAMYPTDADDLDSLLNAADMALYEAKRTGRGRHCFYRSETMRVANSRQDMERALRAGLNNWSYSLRYLPEISLATGELENVEALLRFHHPTLGLMDAGRFLEIAESIGIMPELGRKALAKASEELQELSKTHCKMGLVVDLSARQMSAPNAVASLLNILKDVGLKPEEVTFECPESALKGNPEAMETLYQLASSGCKFTLDDFGAGYCSFSLISQLPMSSIKIDRTFIGQIDNSIQYRQLVAALVAFGQRLHLRTIAEGVETETQIHFLKEIGCDSVQGYAFGEPMSIESLQNFLKSECWKDTLKTPRLGASNT